MTAADTTRFAPIITVPVIASGRSGLEKYTPIQPTARTKSIGIRNLCFPILSRTEPIIILNTAERIMIIPSGIA